MTVATTKLLHNFLTVTFPQSIQCRREETLLHGAILQYSALWYSADTAAAEGVVGAVAFMESSEEPT